MSSSSSSTPQWIYDVFISFRGEDTRRTFVAHLHDVLSKAGINTYIDNLLPKGTELGPELFRAIERSRISIIVFSKNFHTSSWCLKELEHIMKCRKDYGQVVVPVFYNVDPSVLRHQTGDFGNVLEETATKSSSGGERRYSVLPTWKIALTQVADISGWDAKNFGTEVELMSQIVEDIKIKRNKRLLNITDFPVRLGTRVHRVIQFIENHSSKVCLIGICGMGGLGKTTTARAIYNKIQCKFVDHSFFANVREVCESDDKGLIHLQKQLLANVLKTNEKIYNTASGKTKIKDTFVGKKALIVLDDVSTFEQIEALFGNPRCFVPGSILIVTSRDVRILKLLRVDRIYTLKEMDENKSDQRWIALKKHVTEVFEELQLKCSQIQAESLATLLAEARKCLEEEKAKNKVVYFANSPFYQDEDYVTRQVEIIQKLKHKLSDKESVEENLRKQLIAVQEEERAREEAHVKRTEALEELIKKQSEDMNKLMEMLNQPSLRLHKFILLFLSICLCLLLITFCF